MMYNPIKVEDQNNIIVRIDTEKIEDKVVFILKGSMDVRLLTHRTQLHLDEDEVTGISLAASIELVKYMLMDKAADELYDTVPEVGILINNIAISNGCGVNDLTPRDIERYVDYVVYNLEQSKGKDHPKLKSGIVAIYWIDGYGVKALNIARILHEEDDWNTFCVWENNINDDCGVVRYKRRVNDER